MIAAANPTTATFQAPGLWTVIAQTEQDAADEEHEAKKDQDELADGGHCGDTIGARFRGQALKPHGQGKRSSFSTRREQTPKSSSTRPVRRNGRLVASRWQKRSYASAKNVAS